MFLVSSDNPAEVAEELKTLGMILPKVSLGVSLDKEN
jgi:hypothetical protein